MTDSALEPLRKLQHDLANPLSAVLAQTQLLLQNADSFDSATVAALEEIERAARRMRKLLLAGD